MMSKPKVKVWLSDDEYEELLMNTKKLKYKLMVRLGGEMGLRSKEIANARHKDIMNHVSDDSDVYKFLRVRSKRTEDKGEHLKKQREVVIPNSLYSDMIMVKNQYELGDNDPIVPSSNNEFYRPQSIRDRIYIISKRTYENTGNEKFLNVSSHDLRRYYAHKNLVEHGKNPRVVMNQGGWKNFKSIKPYLDKPSKNVVIKEML